MVTWLTISIGGLFFLSGVISCIAYYVQKRRYLKMEMEGIVITDSEGNVVKNNSPAFPIVGIGSMILGMVLAFRPQVFIEFGSYIFAGIIILGTLTQFISLLSAVKYGKVHWMFWVMPILMFLLSIIVIVNPTFIASAPFFFIGWCMMLYGIVEIINALKVHRLRKQAEKVKTAAQQTTAEETELLETK